MKVSRIIALGLLIPLCGTAVVAVYLNAQERIVPKIGNAVIPKEPVLDPEPDPNVVTRKPVKRATPKPVLDVEPPGPHLDAPIEIASDPQLPANRVSPADTLQLLTQEQAADQEARGLAASYADAANDELRGNIKKKLKEKLVAIFAMQQKRRTAEIASIEERLARLKGISNKRETNKDSIVGRRLEQMTGRVDELGWEESNRGAAGYPGEVLEQPLYGELVPRTGTFDTPTTTRPRYNNVPVTEQPVEATEPGPVLEGKIP